MSSPPRVCGAGSTMGTSALKSLRMAESPAFSRGSQGEPRTPLRKSMPRHLSLPRGLMDLAVTTPER
eukprot:14889737-Alexandrium_andersonii.AAC.1